MKLRLNCTPVTAEGPLLALVNLQVMVQQCTIEKVQMLSITTPLREQAQDALRAGRVQSGRANHRSAEEMTLQSFILERNQLR